MTIYSELSKHDTQATPDCIYLPVDRLGSLCLNSILVIIYIFKFLLILLTISIILVYYDISIILFQKYKN